MPFIFYLKKKRKAKSGWDYFSDKKHKEEEVEAENNFLKIVADIAIAVAVISKRCLPWICFRL